MAERPPIVLFVVVVVAVVGFIEIMNGLGWMGIGPFEPGLSKPTDLGKEFWDLLILAGGLMLIIIGLISIVIAILAYRGSSFARTILIIVLLLGVVGSLLSLWSTVAIVELVLCIVLLYILFRPDVKQYFGS